MDSKPLLLLNSLSRLKEPFVPIDPGDVRVYCCGPTVYDKPHLGHARTYIFFDVLCRYLRHCKNFRVRTVMNITDYDDKIIVRGGLAVARKYEKLFFEAMEKLNVERPDFTPRASEFMNEAVNYVEKLREKGFVQRDNRFNVESYRKRYDVAFPGNEKRSSTEEKFLVWKEKDWADWQEVAENGKPGWHTECATMNAYYFGNSVDLHVGGIDLIFPHHENEIALGRTIFEKRDWIRYFIHTGHLEIKGLKMSKSLKNFITLEDIQKFSPLAVRYYFLKHSYGNTMHYKEEELEKAQNSYRRFLFHIQKLNDFLDQGEDDPQKPKWEEFYEFKNKLEDYLLDNLNISDALGLLEEYVKTALPKLKNKAWLNYCLKYVLEVTDKWFGLIAKDEHELSHPLASMVKTFRSQVRKGALTQLRLCDEFREELNIRGFVTEDDKNPSETKP